MSADFPETSPSYQGHDDGKTSQKVELDLDDAPFLADDEEEKTPDTSPPPSQDQGASTTSAPPKPAAKTTLKDKLRAHKTKLIIAGGALVICIVGIIGLKMFFSDKTPPPSVVKTPEPITVIVPDKPAALPEAPVARYTFSWEPFWVPRKDDEGAVRFIIAKFSTPTDNPQLFGELQSKRLVLRDAMFYYLSNRPLTTLSSPDKAESLKAEIMTVINEHVSSGKVEDIFVESFLIK